MRSQKEATIKSAGLIGTKNKDNVTKAPIDTRANLALLTIVVAAMSLLFFAWPTLLHVGGAAALLLALPLVVLVPVHWGLIHEAIHGQLFAHRRLNDMIGRMLSIAFFLPYEARRFGHLMHHRFTREAHDRPDVFRHKKYPLLARIRYYAQLLGGLYIEEMLLPMLAFLPMTWTSRLVAKALSDPTGAGPDVQRLFVRFASDGPKRQRMRRDWLASVILYACAFHLYGTYWPVLAITVYLRGAWLSLADNLPHFDVALHEPLRSRNFHVPRLWHVVLMNHHLHQLHHAYPTQPWTALPALAQKRTQENSFDATHSYFGEALRQFFPSGKTH